MSKTINKCSVCGVESDIKRVYKTKCYNNKFLCQKHYFQFIKFNKFLDSNKRSVFDHNEIRENGNIIEVDCYNSLGDISGTFITDKIYKEFIMTKKWRLTNKCNKLYVITGNQKSDIIYLHRYIMNFPVSEVDHINGNSLDNRKENLREATRQEQFLNIGVKTRSKTQIRGIYFIEKTNKYKVDFCFHKNRYYFKDFNTLEEACYIRQLLEEILIGDKRNCTQEESLKSITEKLSEKSKQELKNYLFELYPKLQYYISR